MNEALIYGLSGFGIGLAFSGYVIGIIALVKLELLKNKLRKLQDKLLDKDIDTTEVKI